jgi:hypothetical protein
MTFPETQLLHQKRLALVRQPLACCFLGDFSKRLSLSPKVGVIPPSS